jgi:CIC family chloride channel protein
MHHSPNKGIPISPSLNSEPEESRPEESKNRILYISFISLLVAIVMSFVAKLLVNLIDLFTNIFFFGSFSISHASPSDNTLGLWVIIIPALGGIIVGLMAYFGSKSIRGHGIPEAMEQILTNQSRIKPAITFLKPLSSAIAMGTGGPFGAEGPIIATGGALGSTIGQLIKISQHERKILLAAGATAGMSAIFGSPLAAIFLAIELLLFELSSRSILPVAIACITGAAGHHLLFEHGAAFPMPELNASGNFALGAYTVIGILTGLLSVVISKAVYLVEELFEKLPIHWIFWPAMGGIAVGVIGYFVPQTLGVGYENITLMLSGSASIKLICMLCVFKFISWAIALGSGTSGGTLAPLMTIGSAMGLMFGILLNRYFPEAGISLPLAALVGMAAMFAGASRALLTSIAFALETTMQSHALLPLLGACLASYLVSYFLMENDIMTEKISRRGVRTPGPYEQDVLGKYYVRDVMEQNITVVSGDKNVREVREWISDSGEGTEFMILTNAEDQYAGVLLYADLFNQGYSGDAIVSTISKKNSCLIRESASLRNAAELMADEGSDLLIVRSDDGKSITGIVSYKDIISVYKDRLDEYTWQQPSIQLKREMMKIIINGKKYSSALKGNKTPLE